MDQMISFQVPRGSKQSALRSVPALPVDRRLAGAKAAYTTRRIPLDAAHGLEEGCPQSGDAVLARVVELGQHQHLESTAGRRAKLWPGDQIVVVYGDRYAPDQFEALVPADLGPCDLVASGGIAARVVSRHSAVRRATRIEPIGLLVDRQGKRINLIDWRLPPSVGPTSQPYTVAVCGTSMNAGKTTVCAGLVRGLGRNGLRVGAAKITGTGSGNDVWAVADAGAAPVFDFTDAGYATTAGLTSKAVQGVFTCLTGHLAAADVQVSVLEVADGLLQSETAALVRSATFINGVDAVIFAANSALGAKAGVDYLRAHGIPVLAVGGVLTMSPLASREAAAATQLPVLGLEELSAGPWLADLIHTPARLAIA
jgi:hypothetical protein